jgi:hypothetical protein
MINKKWRIAILTLAIMLTIGCDSNDKSREISSVIDSFYGKAPTVDYRHVDKKWLSAGLSDLLKKAAAYQTADSARLKALGSTDKPLMIEGDIFTSVLEGSTSRVIESITTDDKKSRVIMAFTNDQYSKLTWKDTVLIIKEADGWKIDDVLYTTGKGSGKGTRDVLTNFLNQPADSPPVLLQKDSLSTSASVYALRTGNHGITIQWIGWEKPGIAVIVDLKNGIYGIDGMQSGESKDEYLKINGTLKPVSKDELIFNGKISSQISIINKGKECIREGEYKFQSPPGKKYWRLQQMSNCEEGMTKDYIDLFF